MVIQNVIARASVRPAVILVMRSLPYWKRDPREVVEAALAAIPEPERLAVRPIVGRLVKLSPRCRGIHRRKRWWNILRQFVSESEALECYLHQFPKDLTVDQRRQLVRYLKTVFRLDEKQATAAVGSFSTRPSHRRKPAGCSGWI